MYSYEDEENMIKIVDSLLNNLQEAICITDKNCTVKYWNKYAEGLYNIDIKEIIGEKIDSFFSNAIAIEVAKNKKIYRDVYRSPREGSHIIINAAPIIIDGEFKGVISTEKEVFARAIHKQSKVKGCFIPVNCSAIPDDLFESEFFGYDNPDVNKDINCMFPIDRLKELAQEGFIKEVAELHFGTMGGGGDMKLLQMSLDQKLQKIKRDKSRRSCTHSRVRHLPLLCRDFAESNRKNRHTYNTNCSIATSS
jgi:transcriptional regulator of aromatic amino acid metabolism